MASATPRPRRRDARPAELLAAALDTFAAKGFAATRMEDIAARAGVAKGTVYLYYPSKEAIFEALVREAILPNIARLEALVQAAPPGAACAAAQLRLLIAAMGEVLGRIDADSIPPSDWVERLERAFSDDPGLDALSGPGRFYGGTAMVRWYAEHVHMPMYYRFVAWVLGHDVLYGSNLAIRSSAWRVLRAHVHRDRADVADDLDLTINLQPGMRVRFDPTLEVGVSARPFESWARNSVAVRTARNTARVNRREVPFLERRRAWVASRRERTIVAS